MKFWQSLAFVETDQIIELAQFCEELGFYGVSYADHLVTTKEQADDYLYRDNGNIFWDPATHWPDPWVLTSALAQVTTTLRFLSTIYILPLRDPFTAAKAISTAATLSNNRVVLGVGVGWQRAEFDLVDQDFSNRGKRTDEQLAILPKLMSGEMVSHQGEYYPFPPLTMSPGLTQAVPIMIGGYAPAALTRATQHDGWMATSHSEEELYPLMETIIQRRKESGLDKKPFDIWSGLKNPQTGSHQRLEDAGLTMTNGTHFLDHNGRVTPSSIDDKKIKLEAFAKEFLI